MNSSFKKPFFAFLVLLGIAAAAFFLSPSSDEFFMPHAHCYLFNRPLMLLHGGSDLFIGLAYVAISATLTWMVFSVRRELPFHWMMLAFAVFIVACGATHFFEVWTLQAPHPRYWMSGAVKLLTALASVVTALLLPPLVPKVRELLESARLSAQRKSQLETAYAELESLYQKVTQMDELKTSFFANVSHELRTPLTLISAPLERLMKTAGADGTQRDLKMMRRNTLLLHKYVNDLLDISKIETGALDLAYSKVNLGAMARFMESVFDSTLSDQRVSLEVVAPADVVAEVDGDKVQRVLLNLLSNALNYTPAGGKARVVVRTVGEFVELVVEDSGPGVDSAYRDKIFERFQMGDPQTRRRFGGSGLGLSIVKEFVQGHGGTVEVGESAALGGAAFTVRLPLKAPPGCKVSSSQWASTHEMYGRSGHAAEPPADDAARQPAGAPDSPAATAGGEQDHAPVILVVEDNWDMSDFICRVLSEEGQVMKAANGKEALDMLHSVVPDLILTDVMMPELTGDELVAEIRKERRLTDVPVLVLTARPADENEPSLLMKGAQDYVTKPFLVEELRARAHNLITAKLARDTLRREVRSQSDNLNLLARDLAGRARELDHANQAKDHFLAVLSHELRTPLTPALAAARMLETTPDLDREEVAESLALIRRNIELEARLVDDMLDFTGIIKGKLRLHPQCMDLNEPVRHAISMCEASAEEKNLVLRTELLAAVSHIHGDPGRMTQIIWNLLLNAVKFTPEDGQITVRSSNPSPGRVRLEVIDTGVGIEPELLPHVFEPFRQADGATRRRFGGLGLGLSVAKGLVLAHGGTISAASDGPGKGATLTLEFDTGPAQAAPPVAVGSEAAATPPLRILLVEDHADTRRVVSLLMRRWGHQVTAAGSVKEGMEFVERLAFDLLLSDVGLPDGTGMEMLQRMGGLRPPMAVAFSGHGRHSDIDLSHQAGFMEHLTKPVAAEQLKQLLDRISALVAQAKGSS